MSTDQSGKAPALLDASPNTPATVGSRLDSVAGSLAQLAQDLFDLGTPSKAEDVDKLKQIVASVIHLHGEVRAIGAVDERATQLLTDLRQQQRDQQVRLEQIRSDTDVALKERAIPVPFPQKGAS